MALGYFLVPMAGAGGPTLEMSVDFLHSPSLRQRKTHSGPVLFFSFFLSWFLILYKSYLLTLHTCSNDHQIKYRSFYGCGIFRLLYFPKIKLGCIFSVYISNPSSAGFLSSFLVFWHKD